MGRARRRAKSDMLTTNSCEGCRKVQKETCLPPSQKCHRNSSSEIYQKSLIDYESETDSAIDTASIISSSDSRSITSSSESTSSLELSLSDDSSIYSSQSHSKRSAKKSKTAVVSIAELEKQEAELDLQALALYVTGVPFQKFTSKDSCKQCIESYTHALHQHQHNQMRAYGIEDSFSVDLRNLAIDIHVEEFVNWSIGDATFQMKEHGYYVTPNGATYYTDQPMEPASLTRHLMIPPSERALFTATHPPQRPWVTLHSPQRNVPTALFTVMNYNVLSDSYCNRQVYGYCPSWALHWDYRKKGILEEIRHYSADIICLQEVEFKQYADFFRAELQKDGYNGMHFSKSRAQIAATNMEAEKVDGCAIFWRDNKFSLVEQTNIDFRKIAVGSSKLGVDNMINRVQTKDNIGVCLLLETKEAVWDVNNLPKGESVKKHVVVTNTHITWDPEYSDVKLIQTIMLMNEIDSFVEQRLGPGSKPPLIICGDFNSLPESGVCEFLTKGRIAANHKEFKECDYSKVLEYFSSGSKLDKQATHPYQLRSAYSMDHMPFTNYTYDFKGVIDYIFHNRQLKALGLLGQLDPNWFADNKVIGCPHPHVHSDHLSLLVEFEISAGDY